ncbi:hypothetical protein Ac2012v2_003655 [Leucoagaricus gongylophorus]
MAVRLLTVALVLAAVGSTLANISLIAWSSSRSTALDTVPTKLTSAEFFSHILNDDQLCEYDAVAIIDQLNTINRAPSTHIARSISSAQYSRSFELTGSIDLPSTARSLSSRCGARFLNYSPGPSSSGDVFLEEGTKHVLSLNILKSQDSSDIGEHEESVLKAELAAISSVFPSHFIIYSSSGLSNFQVRQAPDAMSRPVIGVTSNNSSLRQPEPANPPVHDPTTSVIFTTGLITSLLIVFFILLPVLIVGVSALAGIQTPTRMEAPKGFNAVEKKNQ